MDKLQKVLEADSPEGLETLAVERIKELNDTVADKDKKIDALEKKLADEGEETPKGEKPKEEAKPKEGEEAKPKEGEDTDDGDDEDAEDVDKKAENEKLKAENKELKEEAEKKSDAVKKLEDSVKELSKKTDAIGKKQVKPLFHNDDSEIEEMKAKRQTIFADSRKVK